MGDYRLSLHLPNFLLPFFPAFLFVLPRYLPPPSSHFWGGLWKGYHGTLALQLIKWCCGFADDFALFCGPLNGIASLQGGGRSVLSAHFDVYVASVDMEKREMALGETVTGTRWIF